MLKEEGQKENRKKGKEKERLSLLLASSHFLKKVAFKTNHKMYNSQQQKAT